MRFRHRWQLFLGVLVLLIWTSAQAVPIPALNLAALTREADLILVGQVVEVREQDRTTISVQGHSVPARRMIATLQVARVLKGSFTNTTEAFGFLIPDVPLGYSGLAVKQFGMFFLHSNSPKPDMVSNPYYPSIVAVKVAPHATGDDLDRVIAEIMQVAVTPEVSLEERRQAVDILARVETTAATEALKRATGDLDIGLRLRAAAALLRRNNISKLSMVEEALLHPPANIDEDALKNLAFSLQDGVTDPQAIPALTRLIHAKDTQTRRAAVAALRHIGDETSIGAFATALQDSDREVRYQAVLGLAMTTGQSAWGPPLDLFERDEQRYLTHWRAWTNKR